MAFICIGLVLGAEELKPINWRVWAGKAERENGGGGPFQGLDDRFGFVDIRVRYPIDRLQVWVYVSVLDILPNVCRLMSSDSLRRKGKTLRTGYGTKREMPKGDE